MFANQAQSNEDRQTSILQEARRLPSAPLEEVLQALNHQHDFIRLAALGSLAGDYHQPGVENLKVMEAMSKIISDSSLRIERAFAGAILCHAAEALNPSEWTPALHEQVRQSLGYELRLDGPGEAHRGGLPMNYCFSAESTVLAKEIEASFYGHVAASHWLGVALRKDDESVAKRPAIKQILSDPGFESGHRALRIWRHFQNVGEG